MVKGFNDHLHPFSDASLNFKSFQHPVVLCARHEIIKTMQWFKFSLGK